MIPIWVDAREGQMLLPAQAAELLGPDHLRDFTAALPVHQAVLLRTDTTVRVVSPIDHITASGQQRAVAVGGAEIIQLVTGRAATESELATLAGGGAIAFNDPLVVHDEVILMVGTGSASHLPAVRAARGEYFLQLPGLVVSAETALRLGLTVEPRALIVDTYRQPTPNELAAANDVLLRAQINAAAPPTELITAAGVTPAPRPPGSPTTMFYVLAGISALVTVVASAVAIGLATVELRGDLATMVAVGATPRVRRRMIAMQAAIIVGLGAVLGLLAGIGPAAGFVGYSTELRWHTPWFALLLIVAVPAVLATSLSDLLARGALPLNRREL